VHGFYYFTSCITGSSLLKTMHSKDGPWIWSEIIQTMPINDGPEKHDVKQYNHCPTMMDLCGKWNSTSNGH
jgi:hypothetical protein